MRSTMSLGVNGTSFALLVTMSICCLCFSLPAAAQGTQGQNAVFNPSGNCNQCVGSSAFIDASRFLGGTQGQDLCDTIYYLFTHSYRGCCHRRPWHWRNGAYLHKRQPVVGRGQFCHPALYHPAAAWNHRDSVLLGVTQ